MELLISEKWNLGISLGKYKYYLHKDMLLNIEDDNSLNQSFHIDHTEIKLNTQSFKEIDLIINKAETFTIHFIDKPTFELFIIYYYYLKTVYLLCTKFIKLNSNDEIIHKPKEFSMKIELYMKKETNKKISSAFNDSSLNFLNKFNETSDKNKTIINLFKNLDFNNKESIIFCLERIDNDFNISFISLYKELLNSVNKDTSSEGLNGLSCEIICNSFHDFQQTNFELKANLLEITNSFYYEIVKFYDTQNKIIFDSNNFFKNYFDSELKFGFYQNLNSELKDEMIKMKILIQKHTLLDNESHKIKKVIRQITYEKNIFLQFCFKCGCIMKRTLKSKSNCKIDKKCTENSYTYCYKCKTNYCTYCIKEVKEGKCGKGHLMFKFGEIEKKICIHCSGIIENEGYMCSLCNIGICIFCFELTNNHMNYKCEFCKCNLLWRKSILSFCEKCNDFSQSFWECFYCEIVFCIKCYFPRLDFCGAFHLLENVDFKAIKNKDYLLNICKFNNESFRLLHIMNLSCSFCKRIVLPTFRVCRRCHFQVCAKCLLYMDN